MRSSWQKSSTENSSEFTSWRTGGRARKRQSGARSARLKVAGAKTVEKPKSGLFHSAWESRTNREIPTFPQPQRQAFSGYISNGATWIARVTFSNGMTRYDSSKMLKGRKAISRLLRANGVSDA